MIDPNYITSNYQMMRTIIVTVLAIFIYYVILKEFVTEKLNNVVKKNNNIKDIQDKII
jgi:F0F1-type ATP synthase membrane subunit b/b'